MGENYFIERAAICTNEKEMRLELQRAADIAANVVCWEAARCRAAAEKALAEIIITDERKDVAEQPTNIPSPYPSPQQRLFAITNSEVGHKKNPIMAVDMMML